MLRRLIRTIVREELAAERARRYEIVSRRGFGAQLAESDSPPEPPAGVSFQVAREARREESEKRTGGPHAPMDRGSDLLR